MSESASTDQTVRQIEQRLAQVRQAQDSARRMTLVLVAGLLVELVVFLGLTYANVNNNLLNQDKLAAAAQPRIEAMLPNLEYEAQRLADRVVPVYQAAAVDRMPELLPELRHELVAQFQDMPRDLMDHIEGDMHRVLEGVADRFHQDLIREFPALADQENMDRLLVDFQLRVDEQTQQVAAHAEELYAHELQLLYDTLSKFESRTDLTRNQLEQDAVHHAIMLLDHELARVLAGRPDESDLVGR